METRKANPYALKIAAAGLRHWHPNIEPRAEELLTGVLEVVNNQVDERKFIRSLPCGLNDPRWVEAISRTCMFAIYAFHGPPDEDMPRVFPFRSISAYTCRQHRRLDGFTASTRDPLWSVLTPPFGWLCNCQVLQETGATRAAAKPIESRRPKDRIRLLEHWMDESPERYFRYLVYS